MNSGFLQRLKGVIGKVWGTVNKSPTGTEEEGPSPLPVGQVSASERPVEQSPLPVETQMPQVTTPEPQGNDPNGMQNILFAILGGIAKLLNIGGQGATANVSAPIPTPTLTPDQETFRQEAINRGGMTQEEYYDEGFDKVRPGLGELLPTATPTPTPPPNTLDFSNYVQGPGVENLEQPPPDVAKILWSIFGPRNEATQAASVMAAEHLNQPWATNLIGGPNKNGSYDYGGFQVNENTFRGLQKRRPEEMNSITGENLTLEDLLNFAVNAKVAELVRKDEEWNQSQGYNAPDWGQWYGWKDKGWSFK